MNDEKTKILIVRVIKSAAIDIYRKNKRENTYILDTEEDWIEDKHNPVEVYLATLSAGEMLKKIIGQLSNDDRKIIEMRCYDGMPVSDIGEILGISTDYVYLLSSLLLYPEYRYFPFYFYDKYQWQHS